MALNMPSFLFSSSLFLSRRHSNFRPAAHLQLKQPHRFRARSTTRAVVNVEEEADWIIVDVSLLGLGADAQSQATDLEYDGRELVRKARKNEPAELSVVLCSDEEIKKLNTQWRDKDRPTDVLSFPQNDQAILGDIVISLETARRQASERKSSLREELRILLLHGVLHLMGFDHEESDAALRLMADAEQRMLDELRWSGSGLISNAVGEGGTVIHPQF